jgi:hypothetical protein
MEFKDTDRAIQILNTAIPFLEKLGVCVAVFAAGGALAKFASQVFPIFPLIPKILGFLLVVASLALALLVVYETWQAIANSVKRRWVNFSILFTILLSSVFFVLAGGLAAVKALGAP